MYKRCATEKGAAQQAKLEQCLLNMMQEIPYAEISVRSLCATAGISRKTFYRLFDGKEDVLCALIDQTYQNFAFFSAPADQLLPGIQPELQTFFIYWQQQKPLLDAVCANKRQGILIERSLCYIQQEDSQTLRRLCAEDVHNQYEILLFFVGGIMSLIIGWHASGYEKSVAEMAQILHNMLISPPIRMPMAHDEL